MFADFDRENFPIVKVTLNGKPNNEEFKSFLDEWDKLYEEKNDFIFLFDTEKVSNPDIKYSIKMSQYIKNLRKKDYQYLQKSIILINRNKVRWLLDFIFEVQPPVADVYLIDTNKFTFDLSQIDSIADEQEGVTYIQPSNPLISSLF